MSTREDPRLGKLQSLLDPAAPGRLPADVENPRATDRRLERLRTLTSSGGRNPKPRPLASDATGVAIPEPTSPSAPRELMWERERLASTPTREHAAALADVVRRSRPGYQQPGPTIGAAAAEEARKTVGPRPVVPLGERFQHAANTFARTALIDLPSHAAEGLVALGREFDALNPESSADDREAQRERVLALTERARAWASEAFPRNPELQGRFISDVLPQAFGSLGAFVAAGAVGGPGAAAAVGATSAAGAQHREALEAGADIDVAQGAARRAAALGLTEALPVERVLGAARTGTGRIAREAATTAGAEAVQEGVQTLGSNVIAQEYDPDRRPTEGLATALGAGAVAGGTAGVGSLAVGAEMAARRNRGSEAVARTEDVRLERLRTLVGVAPDAQASASAPAPAGGTRPGRSAAAPPEAEIATERGAEAARAELFQAVGLGRSGRKVVRGIRNLDAAGRMDRERFPLLERTAATDPALAGAVEQYRFGVPGGELALEVRPSGDALEVRWRGAAPNRVGQAGIRSVLAQVLEAHPEASDLTVSTAAEAPAVDVAAGDVMGKPAGVDPAKALSGQGGDSAAVMAAAAPGASRVEPYAAEKANLSSWLRERLSHDPGLRASSSRGEPGTRGESLAEGERALPAEGSAPETASLDALFDQLSRGTGPLSELLSGAAAELAEGGDPVTIRSRLYQQAREAVEQHVPSSSAGEAPRGVPEPVAGDGQASGRVPAGAAGQEVSPVESASSSPAETADVASPDRSSLNRPADPLEPDAPAFTDPSRRLPIGRGLTGRLEPPAPSDAVKPVSVPRVIGALSRVTAAAGKEIPIRVGRIPVRWASGVFKVGPEVIRVLRANDIPVATHEVAHAIEKLIFGWEKEGPWKNPRASGQMQRELADLGRALYGDRTPAGGYKREGWAEYVRLWVTADGEAQRRAPAFTEWFEGQFSAEYPEVRKALDEARGLAQRWRMQGSRSRAVQSVVDPASLPARARRAVQSVRAFLTIEKHIEMAEPFRQLAVAAEKARGAALPIEADPYLTISALRTTHSARTRYMVERGMIDLAGNVIGASLAEIRPLVKGRQEEFTIYLWARRAVALWTDPQGGERDPGLSLQDAQQIIRELDSPEFQLAAGKVYEWNAGVLEYAAQASPTFRRVVQAVEFRDPGDYIPLFREFDDLDQRWNRSRGASTRSPVARLKGTGRRIRDPFQSMISSAEQKVRAAHQRLVLDQIIKLSRVEGLGYLIEEVAPNKEPALKRSVEAVLEDLKRRLADEGLGVQVVDPTGEPVTPDDLSGIMLTFFAPAKFPPNGEPIVPIYDQGKVRWFYVDRRLFDALSSLDVYRLPDVAGWPILEWLLGKPTALFRAGTTGLRASFGLLWNPLRDVQTLYLNSQSGRTAPRLLFEWSRSIGEMALARGAGKHSEWVDAFIRLGGEMAQPLGQDIAHTRRAARRLFEGPVVRTLDPRNWFDFYRDLVQFPEGAPRVAETRLVADKIGWRPGEQMSLAQSLQLLLAGKQVTTDFTAAGEFARIMNRAAPFYNAAIQGPRAHARAARRNPALFAWRGLQLTAASLLLWWEVKDEEWYRGMDAREKFLNWHLPFTWNDRLELLRVPRAFEVGAFFSALPEMLLDAWYREDPQSASEFFQAWRRASGEWAGQLSETAIPNMTPVLLEAAGEQLANRDFFWDTPIVPRGDEFKPAPEQFNEYTSRAAILLGQVFRASPRRIDHAIEGVFGPVGGDLLSVLGLGPVGVEREKELADLPAVGRLFQRGGAIGTRPRQVGEVYDRLEEAKKRQHSERNPETEPERQQRLQLEDAAKAITALLYVRQFTPETALRDRLTLATVQIARDAIRADSAGDMDREAFRAERRAAEQLRGRVEAARGSQ